MLQRAQAVRDEIEREAATKRDAIAAIFADDKKPPRSSSPTTARPSSKE